jgi:hypothetical protein
VVLKEEVFVMAMPLKTAVLVWAAIYIISEGSITGARG